MSNPAPERTVLFLTRDLFFRAKLDALARGAGARVVRAAPADLAVVELAATDNAIARVRHLLEQGVAVIGFASHVEAELLRAVREAGAVAVPNSQIEEAVRRWLGQHGPVDSPP